MHQILDNKNLPFLKPFSADGNDIDDRFQSMGKKITRHCDFHLEHENINHGKMCRSGADSQICGSPSTQGRPPGCLVAIYSPLLRSRPAPLRTHPHPGTIGHNPPDWTGGNDHFSGAWGKIDILLQKKSAMYVQLILHLLLDY